jgi:hypothetical protein
MFFVDRRVWFFATAKNQMMQQNDSYKKQVEEKKNISYNLIKKPLEVLIKGT